MRGREVSALFEAMEQKNSYLLELHKINMSELARLAEGCIDNLEDFYYSRELLLNAINKLDDEIFQDNWNKNLKISALHKQKLAELLNLKKQMVLSILDQDLTIISLIGKIKNGQILQAAS